MTELDPLDGWLRDASEALGLDPAEIDRDLILDLARDAAHGVARPAAPLTTFLVGLAAGRTGTDAATVRAEAEKITALLSRRA